MEVGLTEFESTYLNRNVEVFKQILHFPCGLVDERIGFPRLGLSDVTYLPTYSSGSGVWSEYLVIQLDTCDKTHTQTAVLRSTGFHLAYVSQQKKWCAIDSTGRVHPFSNGALEISNRLRGYYGCQSNN